MCYITDERIQRLAKQSSILGGSVTLVSSHGSKILRQKLTVHRWYISRYAVVKAVVCMVHLLRFVTSAAVSFRFCHDNTSAKIEDC